MTSSLLPLLFAGITAAGLAIGPVDVATYFLRQRVIDHDWLGGANAISMMISAGTPIGAAIGGIAVAGTLHGALLLAPVFTVIGAITAMRSLRARPT